MEIPYTVAARPDTGLYNAKVGIWLFLASEVMLFGGLFSSYVFLRIGADFPWPFHELKVVPGFINTLVLIASSISVVSAWAALKARRYGWYKFNMIFTLLCALGFMGIKSYEYYHKFHHYSLELNDGSVVTGHVDSNTKDAGARIVFGEVDTLKLSLKNGNYEFMENRIVGTGLEPLTPASDSVPVLTPSGKAVEFTAAWLKDRKKAYWALQAERTKEITALELEKAPFLRLKKPNVADEELDDKIAAVDVKMAAATARFDKTAAAEDITDSVELKLNSGASKLAFAIGERKIAKYGEASLTFAEGTTINGKRREDSINMTVDLIDLQKCKDPDKALIWKYFPELKDDFMIHRTAQIEKFRTDFSKYAEQGENHPEGRRMALRFDFTDPKAMPQENAHTYLGQGGHGGKVIAFPRSEKRFYSNFTPALSPYYAIYFLMTGLHGLHVIGGAIVLGWFLFTGRKMYLANPEHLANRVEVGGLFWHFVDLVWIFLFPLYYLM